MRRRESCDLRSSCCYWSSEVREVKMGKMWTRKGFCFQSKNFAIDRANNKQLLANNRKWQHVYSNGRFRLREINFDQVYREYIGSCCQIFDKQVFILKNSTTVHIDCLTPDAVAQWGYGIASLQCLRGSSNMISGTFYALLAGFLGAAASLSAKLSLGADYLRDMCESGFSGWTPTHSPSATCDWVRNLSMLH